MRRTFLILEIFCLIIGTMVFSSETIFVFNNFSFVVGEVEINKDQYTIEIPKDVSFDENSFMLNNAPSHTQISFTRPDSLTTLYEKNLGKAIEFVFESGKKLSLTVISSLPVLKDQYRKLYYKPQGYPIFENTDYRNNYTVNIDFPSTFEGKLTYSYLLRGTQWNTSYRLDIEEGKAKFTGNYIIDLGFLTENRELYLVSGNVKAPQFVEDVVERGMDNRVKAFAAESVGMIESTPDIRVYSVETPLKDTKVEYTFFSSVIDLRKEYVFRPTYFGQLESVFIDYISEDFDFELPEGTVQIFDGNRYAGYSVIDKTISGEDLVLKGASRSIEVKGRFIRKYDGLYHDMREYENYYTVTNLSNEEQTVYIEDSLPVNSQINNVLLSDNSVDISVNPVGEFRFEVNVKGKDSIELFIDYSVPK
ncbi:MAG: hypothetical protein U9O65_10460 [Thermotogota bacterium]|nr:hypothetical protein [Thermotogota bacterium]